MATRIFSQFDTTPTNVVADVKAAILTSDAWSNPAGSRVVATTTRGADMVVDLADASATAIRMQLGVYRTAALADKVTRYISWRASGGSTSDPLHVTVSAGKEHLWIGIQSPYTGEANAVNDKDQFFIGDLVPYHAADSVPAVVLAANTNSSQPNNYLVVHVSRNQANNASWVTGRAMPVCFPSLDPTVMTNLTLPAMDGKTYLWPYVVVETIAGLRGRVAEVFHAGMSALTLAGAGELSKFTLNSKTYIVVRATVASGTTFVHTPWGSGDSSSRPLIAVPFS